MRLGSGTGWLPLVLGLALSFFCRPGRAAPDPHPDGSLRAQAEGFEKAEKWDRAAETYEHLLRLDPTSPVLKERHLTAVRRLHQLRRHADAGFRQKVLSITFEQSLELYEEVLTVLTANYLDRDAVDCSKLLQAGAEELGWALADERFQQEHLSGTRRDAFPAVIEWLRTNAKTKNPRTPREARAQVRELVRGVQRGVGLRPTVAMLEFICAGCNALDSHTCFLMPGQIGEMQAALDSRSVGVGIDVAVRDQGMVITLVAPASPAAAAGLHVGDVIIRVDQKPVRDLGHVAVADLLRGETDSAVELEVLTPGTPAPRPLKLTRRPFVTPAVASAQLVEEGVGYVQLVGFNSHTTRELDQALVRLKGEGMRVLVLDLRGNPGGSFKAGIEVAERFLPDGEIASTRGQSRTAVRKYTARAGGQTFDLPMIVLVDAGTASAAEVVAGALKENDRAILVGERTYGKGSIQTVFDLKTVPTGVRVTIAQLFSPGGAGYSGRGVDPDLPVDRANGPGTPFDFWDEPQIRAALLQARHCR